VTEKTRFAGLASRRSPRRSRIGGRTPFEGAAVLFRGGVVGEVQEWVAQCHGVTPAFPHNTRTVPRMDVQSQDMIPR
jgi:hypothetical protein